VLNLSLTLHIFPDNLLTTVSCYPNQSLYLWNSYFQASVFSSLTRAHEWVGSMWIIHMDCPYKFASAYVKMSIADQLYACSYPVRYLLLVPTRIPAVVIYSCYFLYGTVAFNLSETFDIILHSLFWLSITVSETLSLKFGVNPYALNTIFSNKFSKYQPA
jgi:hypothetical protein